MELPLKRLTPLFRALSNPARVRIVNLLDGRFLCVGDLQEALGFSQPFISDQLATLRKAGLVRRRRQGTRVCYSLSRAPFLSYPLRNFLREVVSFTPELQADVQNLKELKGETSD
jgi:ArsR family transcriptional regulator